MEENLIQNGAVIPRIREIHVRNYRSIRRAVVPLSGFTVLVGPNGSGKTNFLDALAFVQECLSTSLEAALRPRGGMQVRYGLGDSGTSGVGFRLLIELGGSVVADYAFELEWRDGGHVEVAVERCIISEGGEEKHRFELRSGVFVTPIAEVRASIEPDRLALYAASALAEFRPVYDFLAGMRGYSIQPGQLRELRDPGHALALEPEGGNSAAVLRHLQQHLPDRYSRVCGLLKAVVPGMVRVEGGTIGGKQLLLFTERGGNGRDEVIPLFAPDVSDGTLRMLGLLLAAYQPVPPTVLLIEEPEATIHPAAVDVVMSVLLDAAKRSQVVVTTHSPDVLDHSSLPEDAIRVVSKTERGTAIAPVANSSREAIRQRLYSPGELLRGDELNADLGAAESLARNTELFGAPVHTFSEV